MDRARHLVLVLGDQLDAEASALDGVRPDEDVVWMAEVARETQAPRAHKKRIAFFFAAMRHFRAELEARGLRVAYTALPPEPARDRGGDLAEVLREDVRRLRPARLVVTRPGDFRVLQSLEAAARALEVPLEVREDRHFYDSLDGFARWALDRKEVVLDHYYRRMRREHGVLVDARGKPEGGRFSFDADNRASFGRAGPPRLPPTPSHPPDDITRGVLDLVAARFADHPGELEPFDLPVTRAAARAWLADFVEARLPLFGRFQDAMWSGERLLFHARISALLNVKLLDPRACVDAAVEALRGGRAPLASVEGFVRQILGWRELVRGIYWTFMPGYLERNALGCDDRDVPPAYWTGETEMRCVAEAMANVRANAYAHHIERLMVLGLFAQQLGVHPRRFHEWHVAMYLDSVDWASLPNALGMSQYGDGGLVATKPYCATGKYVDRMSDHCRRCRYDPAQATGERACPITTLYWDFLRRHRARFADNRRMAFQVKNVDRKPDVELQEITRQAERIRARLDAGETL